jgi:hypothetical protein
LYTPEISDWKKVILKELNLKEHSVVVEFLEGCSQPSKKDGKFELKKKRKNSEEEQREEESVVTIMLGDLFDVRKL